MNREIKKILIIRLTSLGDVIFTVPLACSIKDDLPDVQVGWVVSEKGLDVVKNNPCVDNVHFVPLKKWKKRPFSLKTIKEFFQIIKEIRKEKYDVAFDCQQMFKSLFLFLLCGAKRRITFKGARELSFLGGNEFVKPKAKFTDFNYHIVERNLDLARHLNINPENIRFSLPEISEESKKHVDELLSGIDSFKPIVVISPATTWINKHWSEKNWSLLVKELHQRCNLVFTGTHIDEALISRVLDGTELENINYTNLAGKTNVEELREVFNRAKLVISPDSGSAHLAWASGVPSVVAIFTCTPPKRFGPYDLNGEKYFSVASSLPCQPCFKRKCLLEKEKNLCRNYPSAGEIMNIVNKLL